MKEKIYLNKDKEKADFLDKALDDYMSKCEAEEKQKTNNKKIMDIEADNRSLGQKIAKHETSFRELFERIAKRFRK
jgi:hypothetical protein